MINKNRLIFGYGDIAVKPKRVMADIEFQSFKPPTKIGGGVPDNVEYYGDAILLKVGTIERYNELSRLLKSVKTNDIKFFEFGGYVFDFTHYMEESVDVCLKRLEIAFENYFFLLAC